LYQFYSDYSAQYWYVALITASYAFFAPLTKYKWAPMTCITLLLAVPYLRPPSHHGIFAIVITLLVDVQLISLNMRGGGGKGAGRKPVPEGHSRTEGRLIAIMATAIAAGAGVLYAWGCVAGFLVFTVAALTFPVSVIASNLLFSGRKGIMELGKKSMVRDIFLAASAFLISATSFGLPSLMLFRSRENAVTQKASEITGSFRSLFWLTSSSAALDTLIALQKSGIASFPWMLLVYASAGAWTGRTLLKAFKLTKEIPAAFRIYIMLLLFFGVVSLYFTLKIFSF
jgi:hypothetical protein